MAVRTQAPAAALVVYAALGIALGMIVWALVLHGDGDTGSERATEPGIFDRQENGRTQPPARGDDR